MNPLIQLLLISGMAMGTIITLSSSHWLIAWIGLEINTLAIIPILTNEHYPRTTEAATKYFLTQAIASALIMLSSMTNAWMTGQWDISQLTTPLAMLLLTLAITMKLGLAPFHFWFLEVMQGATLKISLALSTWQKLAPFCLLYMTAPHLNHPLLITFSLFSTMIGSMTGLNQTQTRKIMACSSITHLGWLTTMLTLNPPITMLTLILYILMTTTIFLVLIMLSMKTLIDLEIVGSTVPMLAMMTMLMLLSLGGLPPLTGFLPKWLILNELMKFKLIIFSMMLALTTLPSLFFYLRMGYLMIMVLPPTTTPKYNWRLKIKYPLMLAILMTLSTLLLPNLPMILMILS
uniref:NADH-ubiquinone oxidoreductase chain 2 n=1 Tax=Aeluroscalabotes felinus TaxID=96749 RepID=A9ZNX0_AELFE|nr:NADH dehydrogenase subunit 2 [Aeluroscalabotes felinus]AFP67549.1 NADH dehydrogenase subunit 2 [Aeluroscalabotes felinus]BAF96545.1 NADH dehydrogenase subunit 2 [Aeluroscalabotes felinus]BAX77924.1 NADH dehydrogenase subunit 2 [Aeluroscalabotes felinus]